MLDRRKSLHANAAEDLTERILEEATADSSLRVRGKTRIADALQIEASGLSDVRFGFALSSHFDNLLTDERHVSQLAVEFHESHHRTDRRAIENDGKKKAICDRLGLPLLVVELGDLWPGSRTSVLHELITWWGILWGLDGVEHPNDPPLECDVYDFRGSMTPWGHRPSPLMAEFERGWRDGVCEFVLGLADVAHDEKAGCWRASLRVGLRDGREIVGQGWARYREWPTYPASRLAELLATSDAALKLRRFRVALAA